MVDPAASSSGGTSGTVASLEPDQSLDPYCQLAREDAAGRQRVLEDARDRYPKLRHVDVVANGVFTVRIPSQ